MGEVRNPGLRSVLLSVESLVSLRFCCIRVSISFAIASESMFYRFAALFVTPPGLFPVVLILSSDLVFRWGISTGARVFCGEFWIFALPEWCLLYRGFGIVMWIFLSYLVFSGYFSIDIVFRSLWWVGVTTVPKWIEIIDWVYLQALLSLEHFWCFNICIQRWHSSVSWSLGIEFRCIFDAL